MFADLGATEIYKLVSFQIFNATRQLSHIEAAPIYKVQKILFILTLERTTKLVIMTI